MSELLPAMIRDAGESDFDAILRLNLESERFLSPLDRDRLSHLHRQASYHRVAIIDGAVAAFLLALREGADYDSRTTGGSPSAIRPLSTSIGWWWMRAGRAGSWGRRCIATCSNSRARAAWRR